MNKEDFKKFRIKISYKNEVPIKPKNPYIEYIKNREMKSSGLVVRIYFDDLLIAEGFILDFYKNFEIREYTKDNFYTYPLNRTSKGQKIYKIKFFKNPPISGKAKESFISSFADCFEGPLTKLKKHLKEKNEELCITYIPSSTKTPDILASKLAEECDIQLEDLISKDDELEESKGIEEYFKSMEHSQLKYKFDKRFIRDNKELRYLVVDDVFGLGSSILTTMKALYDITEKDNYFFIVVKDVKR